MHQGGNFGATVVGEPDYTVVRLCVAALQRLGDMFVCRYAHLGLCIWVGQCSDEYFSHGMSIFEGQGASSPFFGDL